ncbi:MULTISPECIES: hypothetical protein [Lysinibacillus]|uniref:Uncharacterized protein n=1 Tax=Lysinibacillus boronitolerans JCM 21713 = 10a = NBRC 103108 TaxID=1294264 RepID=A0ABR4XYJ7_9BACI|nr:hypothetical protein [Lysinibacillus boronitolerans]KGR84771.1 hypothetical protein CD31_13735 [Lysinibacillus boronitolerans JCM 21713 = 10a = NBRC 103108]MCS1390623.1 hypothetical protein [Lysinibacillus boronitolerans]
MIWSLLINDLFIFVSSMEYFWLLASLVLTVLSVHLHLYLVHEITVQEVKDEEFEVDYNITNTWTPPMLTWFVLCIRMSENNEEESVSPSLN